MFCITLNLNDSDIQLIAVALDAYAAENESLAASLTTSLPTTRSVLLSQAARARYLAEIVRAARAEHFERARKHVDAELLDTPALTANDGSPVRITTADELLADYNNKREAN